MSPAPGTWIAALVLALTLGSAAAAVAEQGATEPEEQGKEPPREQQTEKPPEPPIQKAEEQSREETLFGAPAAPEEGLRQATLSDSDITTRLDEGERRLEIGGDLYLRFQASFVDPVDTREASLSSPNLLNLYLDGRPSDRLRGYVRGRLKFDFTLRDGDTDTFGAPVAPLEALLDQLWLKFEIGRVVYVTVGRQPVRWGSGRFWNPTDFLNQQHRDPLALYDERLGADLVKLHLPVESLDFNFYAVANLEGAERLGDVGGALRGEFLFGKAEIALSAAARRDQPLRLGVDLSAALWDLDVRLETAVFHGEKKLFWRGRFDPVEPALPESYSREENWIPQVSAGAEVAILYSDQDSVILGLEYFFNDAGQPTADLYSWLAVQGDLVPFYLGRHYLSGYAVLMAPGDWNDTSFILSAIGSLSDRTWLVRLDAQVTVLTFLQVSVFGMLHLGEQGEFRFAVEIPPLPGVPPFEDGLSIPAPRFELGLWLKIAL